MKALSLWQPWATLVVNGWKGTETRGWGTPERGLIAIHATASLTAEGRKALEDEDFQNALYHCVPGATEAGVEQDELPFGAIIGIAKLGDCREMTEERIAHRREFEPLEYAFGDYRPGRFEWHIERAWKFAAPIPCKGAQKLWHVRGEVRKQLEARLIWGGMSIPDAANACLIRPSQPQLELAAPPQQKGEVRGE